MFSVTILGNNSAVPAYERLPTSQLVNMDGQKFLVDCGEGTQLQLMRYKVKYSRISHIFISHLHGDHYFGLIGLINSFGLLNRQQDLYVFGPPPLKNIIELQLQVASTRLPFALHLKEIAKPGVLMESDDIEVSCFATDHRITCYGYSFCEKRVTRKREEAGGQPRRYAFCADTRYSEKLAEQVKGYDLIYHEATYLDDQREKAELRYHSTARQAALLAKKAEVKRLLLGHFSSQHEHLDQFEQEARAEFPNTDLAKQGVSYML